MSTAVEAIIQELPVPVEDLTATAKMDGVGETTISTAPQSKNSTVGRGSPEVRREPIHCTRLSSGPVPDELLPVGEEPCANSFLLNAHFQRYHPSSPDALSQLVFSIDQAASVSSSNETSELLMLATKQTEALVKGHTLVSPPVVGGLRAAAECVQITPCHCSSSKARDFAQSCSPCSTYLYLIFTDINILRSMDVKFDKLNKHQKMISLFQELYAQLYKIALISVVTLLVMKLTESVWLPKDKTFLSSVYEDMAGSMNDHITRTKKSFLKNDVHIPHGISVPILAKDTIWKFQPKKINFKIRDARRKTSTNKRSRGEYSWGIRQAKSFRKHGDKKKNDGRKKDGNGGGQGSGGGGENRGKPKKNKIADSMDLVFRYTPYCATYQSEWEPVIIHGLWPVCGAQTISFKGRGDEAAKVKQNRSTLFKAFSFVPDEDMERKMIRYWPNVTANKTHVGFLKMEWDKHGVFSRMDCEPYFRLTLAKGMEMLVESSGRPTIGKALQRLNAKPKESILVSKLAEELTREFKVKPKIKFGISEKSKLMTIKDITFRFNLDLTQMVDYPDVSHSLPQYFYLLH